MRVNNRIFLVLCIPLTALLLTCKKEESKTDYIAENVIIIVVDGPRYTETWGYPDQLHIPFQHALKSQGVFYHNFYNDGLTQTTPGHTAIATGVYQAINNNGQETPFMPSIFQYWRKATGNPAQAAWIIASKDKLSVLANCTKLEWTGSYQPSQSCGVDGGGVGSGYRHDSLTLNVTLSILDYHHPNLVLINFREPDFSGHAGDWVNYIAGISMTDAYIEEIWNFIQNDPKYKDKTALFITNDHGRHLNGVQNGFVSHGDNCDGCRHVSLLAVGPDFYKGVDVLNRHEQRDISATIAEILGFNMETGEGKVLSGLFK
ncbi:MAG: hypothetical protein A3D92_03405 [Bacteroidetes bacterium RIFCSPHIGHO2_02_FULL_44_7]|nr:MAG: hypothetical protein A3D92_03405 [Bacteroidetes bacterium RIFCSPHIGHO2_02_FULL_44_7]